VPNAYTAYALGQVYTELGEPEKARESYEYALLSWRDADPELQPRVEAAREGLARLPKPLRRERP
jgi:tetratricopeptide (TPR) repeat protein